MSESDPGYMGTHYTFVTWKWKQDGFRCPYIADHVNAMAGMLDRFVKAPHRVICVTDDPDNVKVETYPLWGRWGEAQEHFRSPSPVLLPALKAL
jgi:hypothetical protein